MNLLIIEDDDIVAQTIERSLRSSDFHITIANSGVEGIKLARRQHQDLVVLDIIMPGLDGYAVCKEMRSDPVLTDIPILFLTAKVKDEDRIAGFLAGADDYLIKPFNIDELALRIRAILRRANNQKVIGYRIAEDLDIFSNKRNGPLLQSEKCKSSDKIVMGAYTLYLHSYELDTPDKGKIRLTPVQFDLLYHLMVHPGEIFSPARLLDEVWNYPSDAGSPDLVRVHIKNLRERIEIEPKNPLFIKTVAGYGYTINDGDQ